MVQNLWWGAGYNIVAVPLAAGALAFIGLILSPAVGAILMSLSTVIVAINAFIKIKIKEVNLMYNKVFAILIIIFSIIIIASNDTFAESKNDMMNMKEDKKSTMDMTNMKHHDERKKLNSSQGKMK